MDVAAGKIVKQVIVLAGGRDGNVIFRIGSKTITP